MCALFNHHMPMSGIYSTVTSIANDDHNMLGIKKGRVNQVTGEMTVNLILREKCRILKNLITMGD